MQHSKLIRGRLTYVFFSGTKQFLFGAGAIVLCLQICLFWSDKAATAAVSSKATTPTPLSQTPVIRHFVAFKFQNTITPQQVQSIVSELLQLQSKIPQIVTVEAGTNISSEHLNKDFTHAFLFTFRNEKDRDDYLVHPEHKKFLAAYLPSIADAFVMDFVSSSQASSPAGEGRAAIAGDGFASVGNGKIVDLTHQLTSGIPDFHAEKDSFAVKQLFTVPKDGYANRWFASPEHYGTHMDAPAHFYDGAQTIDAVPADKLILPCVVIDVRDEVKRNSDYRLTPEKILAFEEAGGPIPSGAAILLFTGWDERWSSPSTYRNADQKGTMHFPAFSEEAADYLINKRHAVCLGIDTLSLDYGLSTTYPVHKLALGKNVYLLENLKGLASLPARNATLICAPLPLKDGTGSPARILGVLP